MPQAPLLVADVPWLLYRSFFALPKSIKGADGEPVNALLGTVNAILALIESPGSLGAPRAVAACTGAEEAEYRVRLYPPYHAHREPMPHALRHQWERAPALLAALAWQVDGSDTLEADDVMFSHACLEREAGGRALLLTADRDLFGAVGAGVAVVELKGSSEPSLVDADAVRERYGVAPELVPDFIALRGDPSDGLPGAPGIGAKTAAALLGEHGSLEGVLAAAAAGTGADMRPRVAQTLREIGPELEVFKRIATLQRIELQRIEDRATDFAAGAGAARELGMRRLAERLERLAEALA